MEKGAMASPLQIRRAAETDFHVVAASVDGDCQGYGQVADYTLAKAFLRDPFDNYDSIRFLAIEPPSDEASGFV
jgi:hypothetical protein